MQGKGEIVELVESSRHLFASVRQGEHTRMSKDEFLSTGRSLDHAATNHLRNSGVMEDRVLNGGDGKMNDCPMAVNRRIVLAIGDGCISLRYASALLCWTVTEQYCTGHNWGISNANKHAAPNA